MQVISHYNIQTDLCIVWLIFCSWHPIHIQSTTDVIEMTLQIICSISSADGVNLHTYSNLDEPTIINASKLFFITASFLQLGILDGIFVLFFFINTVTSCLLFYISPRALLVTIYFLVGLYALLGDLGVSFSTYLCGWKHRLKSWKSTPLKNGPLGRPGPQPWPLPWPQSHPLPPRPRPRPSTADILSLFPQRPWFLLSFTTTKLQNSWLPCRTQH